jgi:hypothetical protein
MIAALVAFGGAVIYGVGLMSPAPVLTQSDTECDSCSARKQSQKELRDALARAKAEGN